MWATFGRKNRNCAVLPDDVPCQPVPKTDKPPGNLAKKKAHQPVMRLFLCVKNAPA
jgi:hypothetical protein